MTPSEFNDVINSAKRAMASTMKSYSDKGETISVQNMIIELNKAIYRYLIIVNLPFKLNIGDIYAFYLQEQHAFNIGITPQVREELKKIGIGTTIEHTIGVRK